MASLRLYSRVVVQELRHGRRKEKKKRRRSTLLYRLRAVRFVSRTQTLPQKKNDDPFFSPLPSNRTPYSSLDHQLTLRGGGGRKEKKNDPAIFSPHCDALNALTEAPKKKEGKKGEVEVLAIFFKRGGAGPHRNAPLDQLKQKEGGGKGKKKNASFFLSSCSVGANTVGDRIGSEGRKRVISFFRAHPRLVDVDKEEGRKGRKKEREEKKSVAIHSITSCDGITREWKKRKGKPLHYF